MYFLLLTYALCALATAEKCKTPMGQLGKCVPIRSCSSLLWSFTNPKYGIDDTLKKFVCSDNDSGLKVCCPEPSDFLVFENEDLEVNEDDPKGLTNSKKCGIARNDTSFPWLVQIMTVDNRLHEENRVEKVACTGALINRRYVLYSAQCHHSVILNDPNFFVRINAHDAKNECKTTRYSPGCSGFDNYEIEVFTIHPFYDSETKLNDIAILRLSRRVIFSESLKPICLPLPSDRLKSPQELYTAGWNRTFQRSDVSLQRMHKYRYISNEECATGYPTTSYEMCTTTDDQLEDHSIGFPAMSLQNNRWYLLGFQSQGERIKTYTRVSNYLQWIQEAMGGERCHTPYNETGECMHLVDCPKLNDAFANASPSNVDALEDFVCEYEYEDSDGDFYTLKVCCGIEPNFKIPPETPDVNLEISNFKYCGLQHRDDYYLSSDLISVDEFPWLAVIVNATLPDQRDAICGGTLITERYVLTSGQCDSQFYEDDKIMVRLGDYTLKNLTDCVQLNQFDLLDCSDVQEYEVEEEIVHPFYNRFTFINDIALLRLDKRVSLTDYVRPICLPKSQEDLATYGETLYTTGFGSNKMGTDSSTIKKKIRTTLIPIEVCKEKLKLLSLITPLTAYQICSEDFKNSTDVTCFGDEGGPVMHSKKHRWFIEGISSSYGCGNDQPQTHLKVFKYLKWIRFNVRD
ncbi:hypothetical protein PPYR_07734 [Photinus pyralis]|uniref:CLIP domain-containing serine protease n=1 Tax=Photinus pyralis TaxID=7054 RepID=A0A1Y1K093_PHOPY|nr:phenoloxidase-activating factor 1-like [Photinus pyralis]KAB0799854.1 hypothetical protein PPYR_07734 [Photinus pyralis]